MKLFLPILVALVLVGCGATRESARAATMADHALASAQRALETPPPAGSEVDAEAMAEFLHERIALARRLLSPVLSRLWLDVPVDAPTSEALATDDFAAFKAAADAQIPKAQAEAADAGVRAAFLVTVGKVFRTVAEQWLGVLLGTGTAGAGALVLQGLRLYRRTRAIADEAIAYGNDVTDALKTNAPEALPAIAKTAVERQAKRGVWKAIDAEAKRKRAAKLAPVIGARGLA